MTDSVWKNTEFFFWDRFGRKGEVCYSKEKCE